MRSYYRVMLGKGSMHAEVCLTGGFLGTDFDVKQSLSGKLPEEWRTFNKTWVPIFMQKNPTKSKISAGLACGALWTASKGIKQGDVVLYLRTVPVNLGYDYARFFPADWQSRRGNALMHLRELVQLAQSAIDAANEQAKSLETRPAKQA